MAGNQDFILPVTYNLFGLHFELFCPHDQPSNSMLLLPTLKPTIFGESFLLVFWCKSSYNYEKFYAFVGVCWVQVVEDGYEFFAKRQLVTLFSAPNYCGEFDNAGGMMSVDESLMCSFQVEWFLEFSLRICNLKTKAWWM